MQVESTDDARHGTDLLRGNYKWTGDEEAKHEHDRKLEGVRMFIYARDSTGERLEFCFPSSDMSRSQAQKYWWTILS